MTSVISRKVKKKKKRFSIYDSKLTWYKKDRPEQYNFCVEIVKNMNNGTNIVTAEAKVKSGKKDMAIILNLILKINNTSKSKNKVYFISALHRIADMSQREELRKWLGKKNVYSVNNKQTLTQTIKEIQKSIKNGFKIYILLDELDYGSKKGQLLSNIWRLVQDNLNKIKAVGFSATPHESLKEYIKPPKNISQIHLTYEPSDKYYGAKKYIEHGRYKQSTPFFKDHNNENELEITDQGHEILTKLADATGNKKKQQHIAIVRLSGWVPNRDKDNRETWYNFIKDHRKEIEEYVNDFAPYKNNKIRFRLKFVSSHKDDRDIDWDDDDHWKDDYNKETATLIVVNEMAKRSTEWRCHPYITAYHCYRPNAALNTSIQEEQRVVYYTTSFENIGITEDDIDITVYGNLNFANLSAGKIKVKDFGKIKLSTNAIVKTRKKQVNKCILHSKESYIEENGDNNLKKLEKKNPIFQKNVTYTVKGNKNKGTIKKSKWIIPEEVLKKYPDLVGMRMTNIRSGISKWLRNVCDEGKIIRPPIKSLTDIKKEMNEGLNERSKKRENICYNQEDDDYIICCRFNESTNVVKNFKNNSMYSN